MTNDTISRIIRTQLTTKTKSITNTTTTKLFSKIIILTPLQLIFISQIQHHFSNTKVNFCKQKYLPYPLLTTQFNLSNPTQNSKCFTRIPALNHNQQLLKVYKSLVSYSRQEIILVLHSRLLSVNPSLIHSYNQI